MEYDPNIYIFYHEKCPMCIMVKEQLANIKNVVFVNRIKLLDNKRREIPLTIPFPYLRSKDGESIIPLKMNSILALKNK